MRVDTVAVPFRIGGEAEDTGPHGQVSREVGPEDLHAKVLQETADFDALTLRRMEQEEIMKAVLRWLLEPQFYLVPFNILSLFWPDTNDPDVTDALDLNRLTDAEWLDVMEHGEFIKYIHNAIERERSLLHLSVLLGRQRAVEVQEVPLPPGRDPSHIPSVGRCPRSAYDSPGVRGQLHEPDRVGQHRAAAAERGDRVDRAMILTVEQLSRIAGVGGGLVLDASLFTFTQIKVIAAAAANSGSATLTLHNVANLTAAQLTELSAAALGLITFDLND